MSHRLITTFFFLGILGMSHAQLDRQRTHRLDSLFELWQRPKGPGGAIGIMENGRTVYSRAFGMASLEYGVPNQPTTLFNAASVSKQFTALGIVLLHLEGTLDLDRDINAYLPDMPTFEQPITLRQMLHHTSGLRSLHDMLALGGWRGDDLRTNEDLYRFLRQQEELNFRPNDRYMYSNTGYMLMARIIESLTGEEFAPWMGRRIFVPLGMSDTYVEDRYDRVVPHNATSYHVKGDSYVRAVEYWGYVGSGNMHTTTGDLLLYLSNYSRPKKGWEAAFEMMRTTDNFNDGSPNDYAFGLRLDSLYGKARIQHSGSIGGFRAHVASYPLEDLHIALLANYSRADPGRMVTEISKIMFDASPPPPPGPIKTLKTRPGQLERLSGDYWDQDAQEGWQVSMDRDSLRATHKLTGRQRTLLPVTRSSFVALEDPDLEFTFMDQGEGQSLQISDKGRPVANFKPYDPLPEKDLSRYTGQFYSPELEALYGIYLKDGVLYSHHMRHGDHPLKWIKEHVFQGSGPLDLIVFTSSPETGINGMRVSNGRVKKVKFIKVNL